ncbi:hypothetical protein TYRP_006264 [Tyrophagus putrescentiae]|nr:hypothetical protein TYRP_006264 [Tyrophagus putrescentiae]
MWGICWLGMAGTGGKVVGGDEGADDHRMSAGRVIVGGGHLSVKVNRNENDGHRRDHRLVAGLFQLLSGNVVNFSQQLDHPGCQCGGGVMSSTGHFTELPKM